MAQTFNLTSYEPVQVLSEEIRIPEDVIRERALARLAQHHCRPGETPRLTDEWVSSHVDDVDTVEDLLIITRYDMYKEHRKNQQFADEDAICRALADRLIEDPPADVVEEATYASRMRFDESLRHQGMTIEQYCSQNGVTEQQVDADLQLRAVQSIREDAALQAWAEHEGLRVQTEDLYEVIPGETIEEKARMRRQIEMNGGLAGLEAYALKVKAMRQVVDNALVKRSEYGEYVRFGDISAEVADALSNNPDAFVGL